MMYILKYIDDDDDDDDYFYDYGDSNNDDNDAYACIIFIYPCSVIDIYLYVYW